MILIPRHFPLSRISTSLSSSSSIRSPAARPRWILAPATTMALAGLKTWEKMAMKAMNSLALSPAPAGPFPRIRLPPYNNIPATTITPAASEKARGHFTAFESLQTRFPVAVIFCTEFFQRKTGSIKCADDPHAGQGFIHYSQ